MLLLLEYLNLSLMKPFFSRKFRYPIMSRSDVLGTNGGGVACYIRSDIGYLQTHFFAKEIKNVFVKSHLIKQKLSLLELFIDLLIKVTFLKL